MICRILLLLILILTSCVSGSFVVNVTQTSYQAEENHNITLEWTFTTNPDRSITSLKILCGMTANDSVSVLYHVHEGVEVSESQDAKFSGRVQSDKDALREGRIRLQLSRLRTDDSGLYLCEVNTDDGSGSGRCQLKVIAAADQVLPLRPTLRPQPESSGWTTFFIFLGQLVVFLLYFVLLYFICSRKKLKDLKKQHIMPQSEVTQEQLKNKVTEICQSGKGYKVISKALGLQ